MRVFMLGWEFPPFISGGLGTACYGLTKAMSGLGTEILFVLPRPVTSPFSTHVKLLSPRAGSPLASPVTEFRRDAFEHVSFRAINSKIGDPYARPEEEAAAAAPGARAAELEAVDCQTGAGHRLPRGGARPGARPGPLDQGPGARGAVALAGQPARRRRSARRRCRARKRGRRPLRGGPVRRDPA